MFELVAYNFVRIVQIVREKLFRSSERNCSDRPREIVQIVREKLFKSSNKNCSDRSKEIAQIVRNKSFEGIFTRETDPLTQGA